ncbi:family 78 glycoside hydrolase catalytic domain [Chondrinema litorale]|uniref:family 78 glycoside hydrolase catalytic domain n=1 Tax=Chondrinema litorale TaxID=2994555 RepID=UPI002542F5F0|nr:family 78 glycoside hydrolase catalytic domain [Chondrinema litorale]UZR98611.1 family 78 glycoside hydrolase catalytic domain [Chondrinema litorale]
MKLKYLLILIILFIVIPTVKGDVKNYLKVYDLRCDYLKNPLGIDNLHPQFSWKISSQKKHIIQQSFEIQIAQTIGDLVTGKSLLFDAKLNTSSNLFNYNSEKLKEKTRYYWRVRVTDAEGNTSQWSEINWFETSIISKSSWVAKWIKNPLFNDDSLNSKPAPYFRKSFTINNVPKNGRIYVTGLGYFELYINGKKVGDHILDPVKTRYDKSVKYLTFDITDHLKIGENVIGLVLGTGWYNHFANAVWRFDSAPWRSYPELICQAEIDFENGEKIQVNSDETWKTAQGPILFDGIRNGETYDARMEISGWSESGFDDTKWKQAILSDSPKGKLSSQMIEPIKEIQEIKPVSVKEVKPGVWVFDMGQNIAGYCRLKTAGPTGARISLKHGEKLYPDGSVEQKQILRFLKSGEAQTDHYILRGEGMEVFKPHFVYHGFQYVEVLGLTHTPTLETLTGIVLYTSFENVGNFLCSDQTLNLLQQNTRWSFIGNYHGIPTDCPHREKIGWTGDAQLVAEAGLMNYKTQRAYIKWLDDFVDEQQENGDLPGVIPSSGWGYEYGKNPETRHLGYGPQWEGAFIQLTWDLYLHTGDTTILSRFYAPMKKYINFLYQNTDNYTLNFGIDDHKPVSTKTEGDILASGYLYNFTNIMSKIASILKEEEDQSYFDTQIPKIKNAFNKKYYDAKTGTYGNGGQTSLALALYFQLVPEGENQKVFKNLLQNIEEHNYHFDVGVVGLKFLYNVLREYGKSEILYKMVTQKDIPGYAYWLEQGANTLWQDWDGSMSHNHIMFGTVSEWFFESIAGIQLDSETPGMQHFYIKPDLIPQLTWASAEHENRFGKIISSWVKKENYTIYNIEIPANSSASFRLPTINLSLIEINGETLNQSEKDVIYQQDQVHFLKLYSGKYNIVVKNH